MEGRRVSGSGSPQGKKEKKEKDVDTKWDNKRDWKMKKGEVQLRNWNKYEILEGRERNRVHVLMLSNRGTKTKRIEQQK